MPASARPSPAALSLSAAVPVSQIPDQLEWFDLAAQEREIHSLAVPVIDVAAPGFRDGARAV